MYFYAHIYLFLMYKNPGPSYHQDLKKNHGCYAIIFDVILIELYNIIIMTNKDITFYLDIMIN